jgi:hypothetical protein
VTVQEAPAAPTLLMLLTVASALALAALTIVQLVRRRLTSAKRLGAVLGAIVLVYGAALVGVGLTSQAVQLPTGATKCYDDWCASMTGSRADRARHTLLVEVSLENRGRGRPMRSNLATAYVTAGGRVLGPRNGQALQALLDPGQSVPVELAFDLPTGLRDARFVVTEGGAGPGPGMITIGDESSPLHPKDGWLLSPVGGL